MLKGAIFDFDGTLVDSMFIWDTIGEDYLRTLNIEPRKDLRMALMPLTLEEAAQYFRDQYGVTLSVQEIVDGVNRMVVVAFRPTFFTCRTHFLSFFPTTLLPKGFCFSFPDERKEQDAGTHSFDGSDL